MMSTHETPIRATPARAPAQSPAQVLLEVRDRTLAARPVRLDGHAASVWTDEIAPVGAAHLVLAWADGSRTVLQAAVRAHAPDARLAHMDVHGVERGWRPFLAYLGGSARERSDAQASA